MTLHRLDLQGRKITVYENKHTEKYVFPEHHHDIFQILYALDGQGVIRIEGNPTEFRQNDAAVMTPYTSHSIRTDTHLTLLVIAFQDTGSIERELAECILQKSRVLQSGSMSVSEMRRLLRAMLYEQSKEENLFETALSLYLSELLLMMARSQMAPVQRDMNSIRAEKIKSFIDSHYFEPHLHNELHNKLNISSRYTDTIFKERFKMTPKQYIDEVRIRNAQKDLIETDKDITTVCFEVGYETVATFYRIFKMIAGVSPNKYRKDKRLSATLHPTK